MTAQDLNFTNFYESTLNGAVGVSDTVITLTAAPTQANGTALAGPFYLVIDPDTTAKREVVLVTSITGNNATVTRDVGNRHDPDISHADDVTVRMAVVGEMFDDVNDRINDIALTGDVTGTLASATQDVATTIAAGAVDFAMIADTVDEDDMTSNSATKLPTQQSVKAYVDSGATTMSNKVLKDYAETDQAVTSSSGVVSINLANGNTGSITLTENITDIDFTNVPTNGVSTFTLQITQHASSAKTVAINAVTVNGGGNVTAKTAGGGGYTVSTGASAIDLVTFLFLDAGTPLLNALQEFS
jgi:hypothetical protein